MRNSAGLWKVSKYRVVLSWLLAEHVQTRRTQLWSRCRAKTGSEAAWFHSAHASQCVRSV